MSQNFKGNRTKRSIQRRVTLLFEFWLRASFPAVDGLDVLKETKPMNPSILRTLKISLILASSAFAETESENFPVLGKTYDVTWAESSRQLREQIKVLRKGEGSWIFVESCYLYSRPQPPSQPGSVAPVGAKLEKGPTKKKWINTRWLVEASEPESEK